MYKYGHGLPKDQRWGSCADQSGTLDGLLPWLEKPIMVQEPSWSIRTVQPTTQNEDWRPGLHSL